MSLETGSEKATQETVSETFLLVQEPKPAEKFVSLQGQNISVIMTLSDFERLRAAFPLTCVKAHRSSSGEKKYELALGGSRRAIQPCV